MLSDADKRATYDRFGHAGLDGFSGRGAEGFGGMGSIFEDFFEGIFGGVGDARQRKRRGADIHQGINITFEEAALGCKKEIEITRVEKCSHCQGSGSKPGSQPERCPTCNGSGRINHVQQSIFGRFTNVATCSHCMGEGVVITDPCSRCRGTGREKHEHSISLDVPAGVDDGNEMRLNGQGDIGERGGVAGNLYVNIRVSPHKYFRREGNDVIYELWLNFAQVALGAEVEIPTLYGDKKMKIPAGSQGDRVFRLKGSGIPYLRRSGCGDQLVELKLETPEKLTRQQKKLFEELAESFETGKEKK